jgi:tRNA U55 pseudouridine synthase TruB
LFAHARENSDDDIPVQEHSVTINNYSSLTQSDVVSSKMLRNSISDIEKVHGDFRQNDIIASWNNLSDSFSEYIQMYGIAISCSSGFYVRQWVHDLGQSLHTGAVTFSISRTKLGEFTHNDLQGNPSIIIDSSDTRIKSLII